MLSNIKRSSILKTKRFKIVTKLKMKPEKPITKQCSNSIYKMIKSDGLEVSETKRKTSIPNQPTDRKESPRRETKLQIQPIQMRNKLRHVIILSSTAINLSNNLVLVNHHLKKLPNNLTLKWKTITWDKTCNKNWKMEKFKLWSRKTKVFKSVETKVRKERNKDNQKLMTIKVLMLTLQLFLNSETLELVHQL